MMILKKQEKSAKASMKIQIEYVLDMTCFYHIINNVLQKSAQKETEHGFLNAV